LGALAAVSLVVTVVLPPKARRVGWFVTGALVVVAVLVSLAMNIAFMAGDRPR
jgi:hypothetical protein